MTAIDNTPVKRVTMRDIADVAGVPVSAVALALGDKPGVSAKRRAAVLHAADELGYERAGRSTRPIFGLVMEELSPAARSDGFIDTLLQGVYAGGRTTGSQIVLGMYHADTDPVAELVELAGRRLDGIIVANGGDITAEAIERIRATGVPCVLIENRVALPVPSVSSDNFTAGLESTRHLVGLGHQSIGLVQGSERYASLHDRYRGYVVALTEAGIPLDPALVAPQLAHTERKGYEQAKRLLELADPPTAMYAVSDKSAFGALAAITDHGLVAGKDISLAGTDNVEGSAYSIPSLTTFDTQSRELGTIALRTLANLVAGDQAITHTVVQGSLIIRDSTGPVKNGTK